MKIRSLILSCLVLLTIIPSFACVIINHCDTSASEAMPYSSVIPSTAKTRNGLLTIHEVSNKFYFEIPKSLINKDLLMVTRISKSAAGLINTYAGDEISNMVVHFELGPGNRLLLRKDFFDIYLGDSTSSMFQSVKRSNIAPILGSFNIDAYTPDSSGFVINVTDYINGDNEGFGMSAIKKGILGLSSLMAGQTFINGVDVFPKNIEVNTVKTYNIAFTPLQISLGKTVTLTDLKTFEINTSFVLLPSKPMRQRYKDLRIGYFSYSQADYEGNPNGVKDRSYIRRWRLEPKIEDTGKYLKGELVTPKKQIIFYIDPTTPEKWVPFLMQGVNDWNAAFEKAGFKDAIVAKKAPSKRDDSTWSINDARHSVIVYKPSDIKNAEGPSICDPRTGEILESHINWYHNVMELIHDWYFIQCGAVDVRARKMVFDDSLMGQLIRFVSSHEVGHALGLMHNFGSSSTIPVDSLRDRAWVEANGICPSIMDYARFNYVAQPEDSISEKGLLPRIGVYDKWAIEWGYQLFPEFHSADAETPFLDRWVIEKLKDKRLWNGPQGTALDPRSQSEDLGDDAIKAGTYGIKNLKRILPNLIDWTKESDAGYESLDRIYGALLQQFELYNPHVLQNIGGVYETLKNAEQPGPIYRSVPAVIQRRSLEYLNKNVFITPTWLIDTVILNKIGASPISVISEQQRNVFRSLLYPPLRFSFILYRQESADTDSLYNIYSLFRNLKKYVWTELPSHQAISFYRRSLQLNYTYILLRCFEDSHNKDIAVILPISGLNMYPGDGIATAIYGHLRDLLTDIERALPYYHDPATKYHLEYLHKEIREVIYRGGIIN